MAPNEHRAVLATPEQLLVERRALEIVQTEVIAAAKFRTLKMFMADRNAQLLNQSKFMRISVDEHYYHAALMAASEQPRSPRITWTLNCAHDWAGQSVPGSRFGQDNTDNIYRIACIEENLRYKITGKFDAKQAADFSISALPAQMGEDTLSPATAIITLDQIDSGSDGRFEIVLDSTPTDGRRNHLCITGAKFLMMRDSLADWGAERPCALLIERTDGPHEDDYTLETASRRAAHLGSRIADFFLDFVQHKMLEASPANVLPSPVSSAARGGLVTQSATVGHYLLGEDEALVITADRLGARYVGMQIVNMWMQSYDPTAHTSSLNHAQAIPDSDGRYRWVISGRDPGVHNWLDGSGTVIGTIVLRWQQLPPGAKLEGSVTSEVIKLNELHTHLPKETVYLDATAREQQRRERLNSYNQRLL